MKKLKESLTGFKVDDRFSLAENYYEALQDPYFKKVVNTINLNDKKIMKYTSFLEESSLEYKNCEYCSGLLECKNKITGYVFLPIVVEGNLDFGYFACNYQKKYTAENKYLQNITLFDMPKELKNAKMKEIFHDDRNRIEIITWITKFIKQYAEDFKLKGLYLYGSFGSGKTYLIAAMFNELAKQKVKSAIVYWPEFLRTLKSLFNTDEYRQNFETIKKIPLLLIDDIGAESSTEWSRDEVLGPILQYRMQMELPTFFTSNLDLEALEKHFSITKDKVSIVKAKRIIERINQLTEIKKLISKNLRK